MTTPQGPPTGPPQCATEESHRGTARRLGRARNIKAHNGLHRRTYITVLPETSKVAAGIEKALRNIDVRKIAREWGREIERGIG